MSTDTQERRRVERRRRALLRRQDGVITLGQAGEHGLSRPAVRRLVATGRWFRVAPRVYQDATHELTPRARTRAVMLSLPDDAVLAGAAAAWWWGLLDDAPPTIEVLVDPATRPRPRPDVRIVRRLVPAGERVVVDGLRVMALAPTVLDAAVGLPAAEGARLVDRALQRRRVDLAALRHAAIRRSGRPGAETTARLLALAEGGARSEAERTTHSLLRAADVVGWVANLPLSLDGHGRAEADLAFLAEKVIVEIDGWAHHRDLRAFLLDGPRQSALVAAGWVVLRTHWYEITEEPHVFLERLRRTLAARV